jgi:mannitol 2-dehydrogenase
LRRWIESNVTFPNSMVDRITPKTTEAHREFIARKFGIQDLSPVVCESFRQWVLEDDFASGRPAWELAGAQITTNVAPYEEIKMRLLNGGHSSIGYAADLLGYSYIAEAMGDPLLKQLLIQFMTEVRQTLKQLPGIDLDSYSATIVKRFSNPAIRDQVSRICSNGCAKIARFILPSLEALLTAGIRPRVIPLVLACWLHYAAIRDRETPSTIDDPAIESLRPFLASGGSDAALALSTGTLFGGVVDAHPGIVSEVHRHLDRLRSHGARATLAAALGQDHS